ncbi:MAG: NAD(P)H-dependent oxidoreductase [Eubacteriales bacterium]
MKETRETIREAFAFRHACKEFDEVLIPQEDFAVIMEAARLSPSSFGFEPWSVLVVQDKSLREKLLPVSWGAQKQLPTASHFCILLARRCHDLQPDSDYLQRIIQNVQQLPEEMQQAKKARYENFLKNDIKIWGNDAALFEWACRQTYILLGNMMTAAAFLKIDSCPIEGFDRDLVEKILSGEGVLNKDKFGVSCMVAFGYRKKDPRTKTRRDIASVFNWIPSVSEGD